MKILGQITRIPTKEHRYLARLEKELWQNSPLIARVELEGQEIDESLRVPILGFRAGTEVSVTNLIHEMCHFVEIDDKRMTRSGWGLRYGTRIEVLGRHYDEPATCQATMREIRVVAYQSNVYAHLGITWHSDSELADLLCRFMPDAIFLPCARESRKKYILEQIREHKKQYTCDRFVIEWNRKSKILQKRAKSATRKAHGLFKKGAPALEEGAI